MHKPNVSKQKALQTLTFVQWAIHPQENILLLADSPGQSLLQRAIDNATAAHAADRPKLEQHRREARSDAVGKLSDSFCDHWNIQQVRKGCVLF